MSLSMLALQGVRIVHICVFGRLLRFGLSGMDVRLLVELMYRCRRIVESLDSVQQVCRALESASSILLFSALKFTAEECLSATEREVFANDDTKELQLLGVRRHGICGD
jgi:hypothetical protein